MADFSNSKGERTRLYHPYQHLEIPVQKLYELPLSPEHLFHEQANIHRRSWGENLQFYTGSGFLFGSVVGAGKGTIAGVRSAEAGDTLKLRVNRVLNSGGQTGRRFGNSLGVLGLIFAGLESGAVHFRDTDDALNCVLAGLGTGALYRAAAGPRSAAIGGAIGGLAAGVFMAGKQAMKRYVPI